jgi:4'-phosphopantetheinyl transferase
VSIAGAGDTKWRTTRGDHTWGAANCSAAHLLYDGGSQPERLTPLSMWPTHSTDDAPHLELRSGEVHVWCARPDSIEDPALTRAYEGLLGAEEAQRYGRFTLERARRQYLVTRALVRAALSWHHPTEPAAWQFRSNAHGRPELTPHSDLRFNASHCDGLVVCAVATGVEVGVDVEPHVRGAEILPIASRVLSRSELQTLARSPPAARGALALSLWVLKESYGKARGVGLDLSVRSLSFDLAGDDVVLTDAEHRDGSRFQFTLLDLGAHRLAVAVDGPSPRLRVWDCVPLVGYERRRPPPT